MLWLQNKMQKIIHSSWISLTFIGVLVFVAYVNIFPNQFILDDHDYIENWPLIQDWRNLPYFFWKYVPPTGQEGVFSPFKTLFHAVQYHFFQLNPVGYHAIALLNYFLIICLVYHASWHLLQQRGIVFLATLLFALHPVHVEYVSSMTGSVDAIGITFFFISFLFYIRAQKKPQILNRRLYVWALIFAFLAIFTHELILSLPFLFLWYNFCFIRNQTNGKSWLWRSIPFFAVGVSYIAAKLFALGAVSRGQYLHDSFNLTMLVIVKALLKYVWICFFPIHLTHNHVIAPGIFSYGQDDFDQYAVLSQSWFDPQVVIALALLTYLGYFAYQKFSSEKIFTFCIGWFFIALIPVLNIVPSAIYFAERYLFVGSFTFCFLAAYYLNRLIQSKQTRRRFSYALVAGIFVTVLVGVFIARIMLRNKDFYNDVTLFESAVRANPKSALMRTDLGVVYIHSGQSEKALKSFEQALQIRPDDPDIYFAMSDAYVQLGRYENGEAMLVKAIELKPDYAEAYFNLAGMYAYRGDSQKAENSLRRAVFYLNERGDVEQAKQFEITMQEYLLKKHNDIQSK
jgi:tetratricopeptide (TPR) repeat protein